MTQELVIRSIMRDMRTAKIVTDENSNLVQQFLEQSWVAGWEYYRRYEMHRTGNIRAISEFGRKNEKLGDFPSIAEAERITKVPRKTMQSVLNGSVKRMRNGHYFRYTENESKGENKVIG
jgi:hypothetical protein